MPLARWNANIYLYQERFKKHFENRWCVFEEKCSLTEHNIKTLNQYFPLPLCDSSRVCYLWFGKSKFSLNRVWKLGPLQLCFYQAEWLNYGLVVQILSDADWWFRALVLNYGVCVLRECWTIAAYSQVSWDMELFRWSFSILHIFTLRFPDDTFPLMKINGSPALTHHGCHSSLLPPIFSPPLPHLGFSNSMFLSFTGQSGFVTLRHIFCWVNFTYCVEVKIQTWELASADPLPSVCKVKAVLTPAAVNAKLNLSPVSSEATPA